MSNHAAVLDGAVQRPAVLVVGPLPPPTHGCAVATAYVLASGLDTRWSVVHLDTADRRGLDNMGRLDARNIVLAFAHLAAFLRLLVRHRPLVVYVPLSQNLLGVLRDMLFMLPAVALRRRLVVHVHGGGFGRFHATAPAPVRWLVRAVLGRARRVIVLGENLRDTLRGIVADDRISVVPNGMPDPFRGRVPERPGTPLRVLYLGNLIRSKGFLDVLESARILTAEGVDVHVHLAGAWAAEAEREAALPLIDELAGHVTVHGPVDSDTRDHLLLQADVLAFPTYYEFEGHPFVVIEALAASLPVVTTSHAALAETIEHERTGIVVPPQSPAALAAALRTLAEDPALRRRLGSAARQRYLERYTMTKWSGRLHAVIESAAA
jgi:glycosyltransferase involved in cell wall biosynthesis